MPKSKLGYKTGQHSYFFAFSAQCLLVNYFLFSSEKMRIMAESGISGV